MTESKTYPALDRTWWVNLYPDGTCTGTLCDTREAALNRCTYKRGRPEAEQVEVWLVLAGSQAYRDGRRAGAWGYLPNANPFARTEKGHSEWDKGCRDILANAQGQP